MFKDRSWGRLWEREVSWFLDLVLPVPFQRVGGSAAQEREDFAWDFACRIEKSREGTMRAPPSPPACLSRALSRDMNLAVLSAQPFCLFLAGYQCCLMDVFPFLSWLCTIILFSMHHQLPVTEQF